LSQLEKLLICYLDNKSASDAFNILRYSFVQDPLNKNTVLRYYDIFNTIILDFYQQLLPNIFLDGSVEIDETFLFPKKKTYAPHQPFVLRDIWLLGLKKRETSEFLIAPVELEMKRPL